MKNFKSLKFLFTTLALVFAFAMTAFAGTAVIQFGDPKVTRDKVFNVACKVKSTDVRLKEADITIQYDSKMIEFIEGTNSEGGAGTVRIKGTGVGKSSGTRTLEYQLKFRALYAGKTSISILDQEVTDTTDNLVNITKLGASTVTINPSNTQSKNANLSTLEFSPGELDREFDPSVLSYNTEVNADIDSLVISAITEDKDAKVTISGNENFQAGSMNKVTIDVTAPDGKTKKQYVLNVTKFETGVTNGSTTIANGQRFTSKAYTITIMIKPEDVAIPSGYKKLTYENGSESIEAYGPTNTPANETPEVFLVFGMNQDGVVDFYRYDARNGDNTIQRYVAEPNAGDYEGLSNKFSELSYQYDLASKRLGILFPVTIILAVLIIILIIILIVTIVKGGSDKKSNNPYQMDDDDDDDDYFSSKPRKIVSDDFDDKNDTDDKSSDASLDDDIEDLG